jgi:hypothetical protein
MPGFSPKDLQMLRKQYRTTAMAMKQLVYIGSLPNSQDAAANVNQRIAILTVLNEWFLDGGGLIDMLDQPDLYNEVYSWLRDPTEHVPPRDMPLKGEIDRRPWQELESARNSLISLMKVQAKRPSLRQIPNFDSGVYESSIRSYGAQLPDPDKITPQELVEQLDAIGAVGIRGLQVEVNCFSSYRTILTVIAGPPLVHGNFGSPVKGQDGLDLPY